jgi:hypothetical protein
VLLQGALCMQVQPIQPVEVDSSTYHYEDYLADMGNSASVEHGSVEQSPPMETEATHIGRLQAITGARAVETRVKPRGPKADASDYDFILVSACAGKVVLHLSCSCPAASGFWTNNPCQHCGLHSSAAALQVRVCW